MERISYERIFFYRRSARKQGKREFLLVCTFLEWFVLKKKKKKDFPLCKGTFSEKKLCLVWKLTLTQKGNFGMNMASE